MGASVAFAGSFLLTLAVVIPVATLSYYLIEKPGVKLGKRVYARIEAWFAPGNATVQPQRVA